MTKFLIDGDIVAYRCACAIDNNETPTEEMARSNVDSFMGKLLLDASIAYDVPELPEYEVYLTGDYVFREEIAFTAPYKGNRDKPRPTFYHECRDQLTVRWGAILEEPYEADDLIAMAATEDLDNNIIVSLDKDFYQIPCRMYDFVKKQCRPAPTETEALRYLYKQCLTGDTVDNIIGVEGVGPGAADLLLDGFSKESDMLLVCVDQLGPSRFMENMHLVYLLRYMGDEYHAPEFNDEEFSIINGRLYGIAA